MGTAALALDLAHAASSDARRECALVVGARCIVGHFIDLGSAPLDAPRQKGAPAVAGLEAEVEFARSKVRSAHNAARGARAASLTVGSGALREVHLTGPTAACHGVVDEVVDWQQSAARPARSRRWCCRAIDAGDSADAKDIASLRKAALKVCASGKHCS